VTAGKKKKVKNKGKTKATLATRIMSF